MYLCLSSITASGLWERGFTYLFIYFSLQLKASGELKQFITKLTFIALQLRALGNSAMFCWLVPAYKDTLCFCVLFLFCAENSFLHGDTLNGQSTGPTNSLMLSRVCLLHHNNTVLSHTFVLLVLECLAALMAWSTVQNAISYSIKTKHSTYCFRNWKQSKNAQKFVLWD